MVELADVDQRRMWHHFKRVLGDADSPEVGVRDGDGGVCLELEHLLSLARRA